MAAHHQAATQVSIHLNRVQYSQFNLKNTEKIITPLTTTLFIYSHVDSRNHGWSNTLAFYSKSRQQEPSQSCTSCSKPFGDQAALWSNSQSQKTFKRNLICTQGTHVFRRVCTNKQSKKIKTLGHDRQTNGKRPVKFNLYENDNSPTLLPQFTSHDWKD